MTSPGEPQLLALGATAPQLAPDAWVAPGAILIGAVRLHERASVWYGSVLRGDGDTIDIGPRSNLQDGCIVHTDPGRPVVVGAGVSVGHRAVLHGCTVGDDALVGMGAIVLNGARIGAGCLLAAGTVVLEGTEVPGGSLVAGVPGKVRRPLSEEELESLRRNAHSYLELSARHRREVRPVNG